MDPFLNKINELVRTIENLMEELEVAEGLIETLINESELDYGGEFIYEAKDKKWIQKAIKKPGALHKALKVKEDKKIPVSKLKKAAQKGGKTGKRARLALTLRKINEENEGGNWDEFIGLVNQAKRAYTDTLPGTPGRRMVPQNVMKMLNSFTNDPSEAGDNFTDDLIQVGFPADLIGRAAKIRKASIISQKRGQAMQDPSLGGTYRPSWDPNASPNE